MCRPPRVHSNSCPRCSLTKAGWGFVQVQERADRDKWCPLLETEQRCGVIGSRYTVSSNHSKHCVRYRPEPRDADDSPTPIMRIVAMNTDDDVSVRFSFVVSDDAGQNEYPFLFSKAPWRGFVRAGGHRRYHPILACGVQCSFSILANRNYSDIYGFGQCCRGHSWQPTLWGCQTRAHGGSPYFD